MLRPILCVVMIVLCAMGTARADLTNLPDLRTYDLVVVNNLNNTSQEVEGTTLVGGNVGGTTSGGNSNSMNFGIHLNSNFNTANTLTVGGNITSSATITYGNVLVNSGATVSPNPQFNNGGQVLRTLNTPSSTLSSQIQSALSSASANLQALSTTANAQTISNPSQASAVTLDAGTAHRNANGYAVFNINGAFLSNSNIQNLNLINSTQGAGVNAIIINVSGTNVVDNTNLTGEFTNSSTLNTKIIWNFYQATSLQGTKSIDGAVLAATADLHDFTAAINGAVFVNSYEPASDIHLPYQSAAITPTTLLYNGTGFAETPEPASVISTVVGLGLAGFAGWRRRVRRAVA